MNDLDNIIKLLNDRIEINRSLRMRAKSPRAIDVISIQMDTLKEVVDMIEEYEVQNENI